jgi:hypothetical protein
MVLFADEPSISLQDVQQKFTCPLTWWKAKQTKYKLLSEVALYVLYIPATSDPSERVFSVAGLAIAKDQARIAPQTANELIFLHDAIPALSRYEESRTYDFIWVFFHSCQSLCKAVTTTFPLLLIKLNFFITPLIYPLYI